MQTADSNRIKLNNDELAALLNTPPEEKKSFRDKFDPQFIPRSPRQSSPYDYAMMDYVAEKAADFINFQEQLGALEYNRDKQTLDRKASRLADLILKEVSLLTKSKHDKGTKNVFDVKERRDMQIEKAPPRSLISFVSKSEQDRFLRLAKLVLSLQRVKHDDVSFVYQRVFRFLSDLLTPEEFQELSYYHITRLITRINEVSSIDAALGKPASQKPPSLREFIYQALDMDYRESALSKEQMKQLFTMGKRSQIWHDSSGCDPNEFYSAALAKTEV